MSKKILSTPSGSSTPTATVTPHPSSPIPSKPPKVKFKGHKLPRPYNGIQVNVCKNPDCLNYGVEPNYRERRGRPRKSATATVGVVFEPGDYKIDGQNVGFDKVLKCLLCGERSTLRSNKAVFDEITRLSKYLDYDPEPVSCPTESCPQHGIPIRRSKGRQVLCGKTAAGTQRYKCLDCSKVFSGYTKRSQQPQTSAKHREIFVNLVNQVSIRRMLEMTGVGVAAYYRSVRHIYDQCVAFAGQRESRLLEPAFPLPKCYLTTDRQSYTVNWTSIRQRKNVVMNAIASVELNTRYAFGMSLNFDHSVDAAEVEDAAMGADNDLPNAWRDEARLKLISDFIRSIENNEERKQARAEFEKLLAIRNKSPDLKIVSNVSSVYVDTTVREDIENTDSVEEWFQPPPYGMQVHEQYTLIAHFNIMARLLKNAPKVRFFTDQDSGFRAAFLQAFNERVKDRTAEMFYVSIDKELTAKGKLNAAVKARARIEQYASDHGLSIEDAQVQMMKEEIAKAIVIPPFNDKWVYHAAPSKGEPHKRVAWLTEHKEFDADHVARLYLKATLSPVDSYFNQTRRRLKAAERSFVTPSSKRTWDGYAVYNPQNLVMQLEILRVFYNYCLKSKEDGKTPAMRLGLADAPIDTAAIIYFTPPNPIPSQSAKRGARRVAHA